MIDIDLQKLMYTFLQKPLLIGGMAMEYYGLRKAGDDTDFVVTKEDYDHLSKIYVEKLKDVYGDLGVCIHEFEIWASICLFDYASLSVGALETESYLVISLEKLLLLKSLALGIEKYENDVRLIVKRILDIQYGKVV